MSDTNLEHEDVELNDNAEAPAPEIVGEEALIVAYQDFQAVGLRVPSIPHELVPNLRSWSESLYGTRADMHPPADLKFYIDEAKQTRPDPYVVFGSAGYGGNNWFMHYYLVTGPLALFVRVRCGNVYDDDTAGVAAIVNRHFFDAEDLIIAVEAAQQQGKLTANQRLLVVQLDGIGTGWQVLGSGGTDFRPAWNAFAAAEMMLETLS